MEGFPLSLPAAAGYEQRVFGIDRFLRSGLPGELYAAAGFDPAGIREKIAARLADAGVIAVRRP